MSFVFLLLAAILWDFMYTVSRLHACNRISRLDWVDDISVQDGASFIFAGAETPFFFSFFWYVWFLFSKMELLLFSLARKWLFFFLFSCMCDSCSVYGDEFMHYAQAVSLMEYGRKNLLYFNYLWLFCCTTSPCSMLVAPRIFT